MHAFFHEKNCDLGGHPFPSQADIDTYSSEDLQDLFQRFRDRNSDLYVEFIRDVFERRSLNHNACTVKIVRRLPPLIVTLNYDVAIECAAEDCGIQVERRFFPHSLN